MKTPLNEQVLTQLLQEEYKKAQFIAPLFKNKIYEPEEVEIDENKIGAISTADIPEAGEYPNRILQTSENLVKDITNNPSIICTMGKSGLAIKVTKEQILFSSFDFVKVAVKKLAQALARWKEVKAHNYLRICSNDNSIQVFDSIRIDEYIEVAQKKLESKNLNGDTLVLHPVVFKELVTRKNTNQYLSNHRYEVKSSDDCSGFKRDDSSNFLESLLVSVTSYGSTFTIMADSFQYYDPKTTQNEILLLDSQALGTIWQAQKPTVEISEDKDCDVYKIKAYEYYGFEMNKEEERGVVRIDCNLRS